MGRQLTKPAEQAIRDLETPDGIIHPRSVVDAARPPQSPLHPHFEWNDRIAAEKHREDQARELIRVVRYEVTVEERTFYVPQYVPAPGRKSALQNVVTVARDEDNRRAALLAEMKRVCDAAERAKSLARLFGMADRIEEIRRMADDTAAEIRSEGKPEDRPGGNA